MIPLALGTALASLFQGGRPTPIQDTGKAPPPQVPLSKPLPGPQAPFDPTGALPPRPIAPPPRVNDPQVPPPVVAPNDAASPEIAPGPLTAQEAGRIALRLQPSIQGARGAAQTARGNATITGADLNPQLIVGTGYANARTDRGLGGPTGVAAPGVSSVFPVAASAGISQLLFDFNRTRNLLRQDRALTAAALADLDRTALNAVLNVESAVYDVANDRRLVLTAEANVTNRQRQLVLAQARFSGGIGVAADVVTAETLKAQAVQALIQARDREQQDRVTLLQSMGLNPLTPVAVAQDDEPAIATADARGLILFGIRQRPEVRTAAFNLEASRHGLSAAKAVSLPALVGTIGTGLGAVNFGESFGSSYALTLGFSFPAFDGGRRRGAVDAANGRIATAQADLKTAILQVQGDVVSAFLSLQAAEQRVVAAESEVINAQEGLRIAEGRYANGLGLFLDIVTAQTLLNTALQDQTNARNAVNLARVRLRYATGRFAVG